MRRGSRLRSYDELVGFDTFAERFQYLVLGGSVGFETFGFDRYLNQNLYKSREWRDARERVLVRDLGCDLGIEGYDIHDRAYIHHMNPMVPDDIKHGNPDNFDPRFLITVTHRTHNAIHYGDVRHVPRQIVERTPGDTAPWKL